MRSHLLLILILTVASATGAQEATSAATPAVTPAPGPAQQAAEASAQNATAQQAPQPETKPQAQTGALPDAPTQQTGPGGALAGQQQPKRILGIMPNYRAVSAGLRPPPPSSKQAFILAAQNSFDYSSFLFVGITSLLAKGTDTHPDLGKGPEGLWAYTWRGFVDKTDGNFMVLWALPTVLHEDERYYAMGRGRFLKRAIYAGSRVIITPDYHGRNTFNGAELVGRAAAQAVSTTYYPEGDDSTADLSEKFAYSIGRDALTNVFREFWPDIARHVLHRHP
ncbi:MAG: hypothetical protein KGJ51_05700 [Acidobacteriota bacterium]|nr:hypothetical protein [Acidobacteriota bacterium]